jgi:hypothetical protein
MLDGSVSEYTASQTSPSIRPGTVNRAFSRCNNICGELMGLERKRPCDKTFVVRLIVQKYGYVTVWRHTTKTLRCSS